jgi:hypothetical protein
MTMQEPTPEDAAAARELIDWALARLADRRGVLPASPALARGVAMLMPTRHAGETVLRFCFVNPLTTREDVDLVLAALS